MGGGEGRGSIFKLTEITSYNKCSVCFFVFSFEKGIYIFKTNKEIEADF